MSAVGSVYGHFRDGHVMRFHCAFSIFEGRMVEFRVNKHVAGKCNSMVGRQQDLLGLFTFLLV